MRITYYGHSSFLVEFGGKRLLIDPFISFNPLAKHLDIHAIQCDYILLSHAHEDHMTDVEEIAVENSAKVISSYEIVTWYAKKEVAGHPMNLGGKWAFDFGTVKMVHAAHSSMFPSGEYGGPSAGFVIWNDTSCLYFAGDTALTMDMKLLPLTCPTIDVAIFPLGDNFTMGYKDAIIASDFIGCDQIVGCHYDSFDMIKLDHNAAKSAFHTRGKSLDLLNIGESKEY